MKSIVKSLLLSSVLVISAVTGAALAHLQGGENGGLMMNSKMMDQKMMQMRDRMQENHALMEKIIAEQDSEKRDKMMQEHMQSMQRQMEGMNKMMADELAGGTPSSDMDERMKVMDMRMQMMQMMMGQMMDYQGQAN